MHNCQNMSCKLNNNGHLNIMWDSSLDSQSNLMKTTKSYQIHAPWDNKQQILICIQEDIIELENNINRYNSCELDRKDHRR